MNTPAVARILIVDDEIANMRALCDILRDHSYETEGYAGGREALEALRRTPFDLLLTDLMMPEMDGVELLTQALKIDPHISGILMTGQGTIATAVQAMQAGAMDYVLKPLKTSTLLPVLSRAATLRRLRLENMELRDTVAIHEFSQALAHTLDPHVLLDKIADAALAQFEADETSIMLVDDVGETLQVVAVRGPRRETLLGTRVALGEGVAGRVAASRQFVVLEGEVKDGRYAPSHPRAEIQSALSMPMISRNRLIGVLNVNYTRQPRTIPFGQIKVLSIFVNTAAISIEAARLYEDTRKADARYREILDMAADGIVSTDDEQRILVFNSGAEKIFGYSTEEILGKSVDVLLPGGFKTEYDGAGQGMREPSPHRVAEPPPAGERDTLYGRHKDGKLFPVEAAISTRAENGKVLRTAVVRDVSARVRADEMQRKYYALAQLLSALAAAANEAVTPEGALNASLNLIRGHGEWLIGHLTTYETTLGKRVAAKSLWQVEDKIRFSRLMLSASDVTLEHPVARQFMHRVIAEKAPVWYGDLAAMVRGERLQHAFDAGLNRAFAFPVLVQGEIAAVLEFFGEDPRPPDTMLLDSIPSIDGQLARVIERARANQIQQRMAAIVESSQDAIISTLADGTIETWNRGAQALFGYTQEDIIGRNVAELIPDEFQGEALDHRDSCLAGEAPRTFDTERLTRDKRRIPVSVNASLLTDSAGAGLGFATIYRDIAERKQAETALRKAAQRLEIALEGSRICVWESDMRSNQIVIDANWAVLLGLPEMGETHTTATELMSLVHPDDRKSVVDAAMKTMNQHISSYAVDHRVRGVDGEWRWILSRGRVIERDDSNRPLRMIGTNTDITDRKLAESTLLRLNEDLESKVKARTLALERARHEAEEANSAKSMFLATMSHEIRTPMNGVIGMIDVLHQSSLRGDQVEMVELIRESAFSLLGIINDVLDFSKIEAGKLELENERLSVAEVMEGVASLMNGMAAKKSVTLTVFIDPTVPRSLMGDTLRLRQVLTNLVNNAIKFSSGKARQGRVSMRAQPFEDTAERLTVAFRISDNGIGMDQETQDRLFTAFTQADLSTTRRFGGTGLGLAIAKQLLELMGGTISVQSAQGEGATFEVRVPFQRAASVPADTVTGSLVAGLTCVVVGNDGGLTEALASYLKHAQAVVERAPNLWSAQQLSAGRDGPTVWIVDAGEERFLPEQVLSAARAQSARDVRIVCVRIARGKRSRPRMVTPDLIMLDGNALSSGLLLRAVAAAAGRTSLESGQEALTAGRTQVVAPTREEACRRGRLILVAEDNETNQKVILRQLALLGHTADVAVDGLEALRRWRTSDYAMLLTDLHMPNIDGYELATTIRHEEAGHTHMPIVALTANALKGEAERCRECGMDDYCSKPIPLAELKAVLDKWLPESPLPAKSELEKLAPADSIRGSDSSLPVDVAVLERLVGAEPAVVKEFLQDFHRSAVQVAAELRAACAAGRYAVAADAAHKLKSSARSVGAIALGEVCAAIETEGKASNDRALAALLPRFEDDMRKVEAFLDQYQ